MENQYSVLTLATNEYTLLTGETIFYYDSAPQADQELTTIVLLHGYCGSSAYFSKLILLLSDQYRILVPDLVGHGKSTASEQSTYTMELAASWIDEWILNTGINNVHLFGHSLGGYITLAIAERNPTYLRSFGLLHSTALPDSDQAKANRDIAIETVQEQGVASFVSGLVVKLFAEPESQPTLLDYALKIGQIASPSSVIGYAKGMQQRLDRTDIIRNASLPVLLVSGGKDRIVTSEGTFAGSNQHTSCHIIADSGHMGMLETPEQLTLIIKQFLN
ncbi:alpha/beta fold hydrolase [Paenibacillus endoradicis]|uniref:alpha/beta fold hydrolase n=1 Tax=Paenibacillus endoradicis TaxID=2972487 RepID=UPI002159B522|nr:alpha/beta hydrolase [Paenibacillus endoradicis]MCR8657304.1 alpha/beta hydrolase [Paenibacillus endoradicis]